MKGDFSRVTFDPTKHFSQVLKQQGRVTLDADDNEQSAILLHYMRTLARDLIGPYGVAADGDFEVSAVGKDLKLTPGRIYVDGILVENDVKDWLYTAQKDHPLADNDALLEELTKPGDQAFWIYLDVWERYITALDDDDIREKALGGPDTCGRAKVVWQVKGRPVDTMPDNDDPDACSALVNDLRVTSEATLAAQLDPGKKLEGPCVLPPDSKYRGAENQLYRVEVHRGNLDHPDITPTFKWSRDDGSVVTRWLGPSEAGEGLRVSRLRGFNAGNWVEVSDDAMELRGEPGVFVKLTKVEGETLSVDSMTGVPAWSSLLNPKVRRWDQVQRDDIELDQGAVLIEADAWIDLEDGVQVWFSANGTYRTGDYWLIPARVETRAIEWPAPPSGKDKALIPPHGVEHHYAPLGFIKRDGDKWETRRCQCLIVRPVDCHQVTHSEMLAPGTGKPAKPSRKTRRPKP